MAQEVNLTLGASLSGGTKATFNSLSNGFKKVAKGLRDLAKEQIKLGNKGKASALNETAKATDKLSESLDGATKSNKKFNASSKKTETSAGKLKNVFSSLGKSMQTYSRYMVASNVMLGLIGGFKAATDAVIEYDQGLKDLSAITLASAVETEMLGQAIVKVASATKFSMSEIAGAMKRLAQAGFSATEVTGMIGSIAELATGSLESLDVTVKLVSTAIRVFGMDVKQSVEVVDIFANAVNKSRLTVAGLSTTFNYIGPIAAATGLSLKDTSASMMLLANSGLRFSTIGTGLRRIIGGLAKPSGKFKEAILEAGYTLADFNPNLSNFRDILTKIPKVVKDSTDAIEFFGYRGSSVISAFSTQGVSEYDRLRKAVERTGTTSEMAAKQMEGLKNAIKNIKDRFGVLAKTLAEGGLTTILKTVVDLTRKLLSLLIAIAGNPLGQAIMSFTLLAGAITSVVVAFQALKAAGLGVYFVKLASQLVAVHTSLSVFGAASLTGAAGAATLGSAVKGLSLAFLGLALNPVIAGLALVTAGVIGVITYFKAKEKALRSLAIEQEKYSSTLESTQGKLDAYKSAVAEYGENSKEANKAALNLKMGVETLGDEYEQIATPLSEFTKRVDSNTGSIMGSKDAISGLEEVLGNEFEKSTLAAIAASEKLAGVSSGNAEQIRRSIAMYEGFWYRVDQLGKGFKKLGNIIGVTFDTDVLDTAGLEEGMAHLDLLKAKIKEGNAESKEEFKTFQSNGQKILDILFKEGDAREELKKMTDDQIRAAILGMKNLTYAQKASVAAAVELGIEMKNSVETLVPGKDKEVKRLADIDAAYKRFGLTIDGTSVKLNTWITSFNKLVSLDKEAVVSGDKLVKSFEKVGNAVKNTKDFAAYTEAMEKLRDSGRLSGADLLELEKITKKAFEGIRSSASDLSDSLDEDFKFFDLEEQKAETEQWKTYVENTNTENEITEKQHTKNLELMHLEFLRKKMERTNMYYEDLKNEYNVDAFQYQAALIKKLGAEQTYLKAKANSLKPDKQQEKKGFQYNRKESDNLFDAAIKKQEESAKTLAAALKSEYDTNSILIEEFYEKKRILALHDTEQQKRLIEDRIATVNKEYTARLAISSSLANTEKLEHKQKMELIDLESDLNTVQEEGYQILSKINGEKFKALDANQAKIDKTLDESLVKQEDSELARPDALEEDTFRIKLEQLQRFHDDEYQKLIDHGAKKHELDLLLAQQEKEVENIKLARQRQVFQLRLDSSTKFAGDMASITKAMMDSGLIQSKKFFKAYQAFAIAETMISTYSTAQKAYEKGMLLGGPWGTAVAIAGAAAAVVQGMARVAQISSQKPAGYAKGGLIGGTSPTPTSDDKLIRVTSDEYVQQGKAVKHYGVGVMDAMNNLQFPKAMFEGFTKKPQTVQKSFALAGGGQIPKTSEPEIKQTEQKQAVNIINVTDPREIGNYLATSEGSNALLNVLSSKSETVKRILR